MWCSLKIRVTQIQDADVVNIWYHQDGPQVELLRDSKE